MAVRKRFSKAERELLTSGYPLEVQNVTQWHAATLRPGAEITRDSHGWETIAATIDKTRGTVRAGDPWPVSPGHVRARQAADVTADVTDESAPGYRHYTAGDFASDAGVPAWHGQRYPADAIGHARAAAWLTGWPASDD